MAKLTWAKKLNNRLKRNWNTEIDFSKCFKSSAFGKRSTYEHGDEIPFSDTKWEKVYRLLIFATKKDTVTIEYKSDYQWDDNYESAQQSETEYYGFCIYYVTITVTTPTGRKKLNIDLRYV